MLNFCCLDRTNIESPKFRHYLSILISIIDWWKRKGWIMQSNSLMLCDQKRVRKEKGKRRRSFMWMGSLQICEERLYLMDERRVLGPIIFSEFSCSRNFCDCSPYKETKPIRCAELLIDLDNFECCWKFICSF